MALRSAFLGVLFISSTLAVGAGAADENVVVTKKQALIFEDSSEANRLNKKGSITLELFGAGPSYSNGAGLGYSHFLNRNQQLMIELKSFGKTSYRSSTRYSNGVSEQTESQTSGTALSATFKMFTGNSFYIKPGIDIVSLNYKFSPFGLVGNAYQSEFALTSLGGEFSIGNQWQWDGFTLGCDWVGLRVPVTKQFSSEILRGDFDESDRRGFEDDKKLYAENGNLMLLKFYLGASF